MRYTTLFLSACISVSTSKDDSWYTTRTDTTEDTEETTEDTDGPPGKSCEPDEASTQPMGRIEWSGHHAEKFGTSFATLPNETAAATLILGAPSYGITATEDASPPFVYVLKPPLIGGDPSDMATTKIEGDGDGDAPHPGAMYVPIGIEMLTPGDVTGDGVGDLVLFDYGSDAYWRLGAGAFVMPGPLCGLRYTDVDWGIPIAWPGPWRGTACGDLDGDADNELCLATGIAFGPVTAGFTADVSWSHIVRHDLIELTHADLDGDGRNELLLWDPDASVLHHLSSFPPGDHDLATLAQMSWTMPPGGRVTALASGGDLDGDGRTDFAVAWTDGNTSTTWIVTDSSAGGDLTNSPISFQGVVNALAIADFDADSHSDLALGGEGSVHVFRGPLSPGLLDPSLAQVTHGYESPTDRYGDALLADDIDRDGRADLLVGAPDEGLLGNELQSPPPTHGRVFFLPAGGL